LYDARSLPNQTCLQTRCVCHYFPFLAALHRRKRGVHFIEPIRAKSARNRPRAEFTRLPGQFRSTATPPPQLTLCLYGVLSVSVRTCDCGCVESQSGPGNNLSL